MARKPRTDRADFAPLIHNPRPLSTPAAASIARAVQGVLETLEKRTMLSDNIFVDARQLVLVGSARRENVISLDLSRDRATLGIRVNGERTSMPAAGIDTVLITGGRYADSIIISDRITLATDIMPGNGADSVIGGSGSDNIVDPSAGNRFYTGAGNDFIRGGPGDETVYGGDGDDVYFGGGGIDRFYGEGGDDYFDGGEGKKNIMYGGPGDDKAVNASPAYLRDVEEFPGSGAVASASAFRLVNGVLSISGVTNKNNIINVSMNSTDTYVVASVGVITQSFRVDGIRQIRIVGGSESDFLNVSPSVSIGVSVEGGSGDDTIFTGSGPDTVNGGNGNDRIFAGAGSDLLNGGAGNDTIYGQEGDDSIVGSFGNDRMHGGDDRDFFDGGDGIDYADGGDGTDAQKDVENHINVETTITNGIPGGGGTDTTPGGGGTDTTPGGGGTDTTPGGGGTDTTPGGGGTDTTPGGGGDDTTPGNGGGNSGGTVDPDGVGDGDETDPNDPPPPVTGTVEGPRGGTKPAALIPVNVGAANPVVNISAYQTTAKVGQAVFVHGLNSNVGAGNQLTARYEWDFGDPDGAYNNLVGFNASHVYDQAGQYTITLKIFNNDRGAATSTFVVNVTESGRRQIFVSESGNDSNNGSANSPIKSFARAAELVAGQDNVEVLFKRGEGFATEDSEMTISGDNVRVTSYGSGDKPYIYYNGPRDMSVVFRTTKTAAGTTIENLTIDSRFKGPDANRKNLPHAIKPEGVLNTVRNVTFLNVGYAINANAAPTGLHVQDSDAPTDYGLRGYLVWAQGSDVVLLGNKVVNSTHEHPVRIWEVDRLNVSYNDFANPQVHAFETMKTAFNLQAASNVTVYGNTFRGPRLQIGPLGGADGVNYKSQRTTNVVFEANHTIDTKIEVEDGAENVVIRNNVLGNYDTTAIDIDGYDPEYGRGVVNLSIVNNTIFNLGTRGNFIALNGSASGIDVINNLYRADNVIIGAYKNSAIYVAQNSLNSFRAVTNNVWPSFRVSGWIAAEANDGKAVNLIGADASDISAYYSLAEWNAALQVGTDYQSNVPINGVFEPGTSSIAAGNGFQWKGVLVDYFGNVRPTSGGVTIGAVQV